MKKFKRITSLVVAMAIAFSVIAPYANSMVVSATDTTDDLTGWEVGSKSTITGNPTDGWEITVNQTGDFPTDKSYYTANMDVADMQVKLDLSKMGSGYFKIHFGKEKFTSRKMSETSFTMFFNSNGSKLSCYTFDADNTQIGIKEFANFDFTTPHTFELKEVEGVYQPTLDGTSWTTAGVDTFVRTMATESEGQTMVSFVPEYKVKNVANINFVDKSNNDLTGWEVGSSSKVTGNPTDGWAIKVNQEGDFPNDRNYYNADMDVSDLQLQVNLSTMEDGYFILHIGKGKYEGEKIDGTNFSIRASKNGSTLDCYAYINNGFVGYNRFENVDFTATYTFEFTEVEGVYKPTMNGYSWDMEGVDNFVRTMKTESPGKTVVGFVSEYKVKNIANVKFIEKVPVSTDDLTGWEVGSSSTITGNPTDGWEITVNQTGDFPTNKSYYTANMDVADMQVKLDLSKMGSGYFNLHFGKEKHTTRKMSETSFTMTFNSNGSKLSCYTFDADNKQIGIKEFANFDFTTPHIFEFKKVDGVYQPTLDGTSWTTAGVDTFVRTMATESEGQTIVSFVPEYKVKNVANINFVEKSNNDLTGWEVGSSSTITGNPTDGWVIKVDQTGDFPTDKNYYNANIGVSRLQVKFNLSTMEDGYFILHLGKDKYTSEKLDETDFNIRLSKSGTRLDLYMGSSLVGYKQFTNFDFSTTHTFEFKKVEGVYQPTLDGTSWTMAGVDNFVKAMATASAGKTVVGFVSQYKVKNVANVNFVEKAEEPPASYDDLTGWEVGNKSTITGNPTDGWEIIVNQTGDFPTDKSYYTSNIDVAHLQVQLDLSKMGSGYFQLHFGKEKFTSRKLSDTSFSIYFNSSGTKLSCYLFDANNKQIGIRNFDNFDFNAIHTFEFKKVFGAYQPTLDGVSWTVKGVDDFVNTMVAESADKTIVSFVPEYKVKNVANIKFLEKGDDLYSDWYHNKDVIIDGDKDSGYNIYGKTAELSTYCQKLKPSDTTISFQFNTEENAYGTIDLLEDTSLANLSTFTSMQQCKAATFVLQRNGSSLSVQIWNGYHVVFLKTYDTFDFDAVHTLTITNEHGNWYAVFDGEVLRDCQLNMYFEAMLTAKDGIYYRFGGSCDTYTYKKVKFLHTPKDASATSNWNVEGYEMSGRGDALSFTGKLGSAAYKQAIDLTKNSIYLQYKPVDEQFAIMTLSGDAMVGTRVLPSTVVPESNFDALTFILGRQNGTGLRLSLFGTLENGQYAECLIAYVSNFDYDAVHEFRFVEKDGNYYIALDGELFDLPAHDGEKQYITKAITKFMNDVNNKAYLRFSNENPSDITWTKISFEEKAFTAKEVYTSGEMVADKTQTGVSASGTNGLVGLANSFDILKTKIQVQFELDNDKFAIMTIGNTGSSVVEVMQSPENPYNMMCFVLGRQQNNVLRISLWDGEKEVLMTSLQYFDFSKPHTFSFKQHRGNYYLAIDDRMIENIGYFNDDAFVTGWITKAVSALAEEGAYVRFFSYYPVKLSKIALIESTAAPYTGDSTSAMPFVYLMVAGLTGVYVSVTMKQRRKREDF